MLKLSRLSLIALPCAWLLLAPAPAYSDENGSNEGEAGSTTTTQSAGSQKPDTDSPKSTADIDPGVDVRFDLETGRFLEAEDRGRTLPFDVQFFVVTDVKKDVVRLDGRYVGDTSPLLCERAFPRAQVRVDYGFGPREPTPIEARNVVPIGRAHLYEEGSGAQKKHRARLNVATPLLPNRYYCFEFSQLRKPTDIPTETITKVMAVAMDQALQAVDPSFGFIAEKGEVPKEVYKGLWRTALAAARRQVNEEERLLIPSEETATIDLPLEARQALNKVLETQINRRHSIGNLEQTAKEAREIIIKIKADPTLIKLQAASRMQPPPPELTALGLSEASVTVIPEDPVAPVPYEETWKPEDLEAREKNFQQIKERLESLSVFLTELKRKTPIAIGQQTIETSGVEALENLTKGAQDDLSILLEDNLPRLKEDLANRKSAIVELAGKVSMKEAVQLILEIFLVEGSTVGAFDVRGNWYFSMDLGIALAEDVEDFFTYTGVNIYFRPVNKKAPLRWSDFRQGQWRSELLKRLSLTVGMTLDDLKTDDGRFAPPSQEMVTQGLIGDKQIVLAGGLRLNSFFRVSLGALVFKEVDPSPLIDDSRLAWAPMFSASIDWNFRGFLRDRFREKP